ncbi:MAG: type II secretion system protein [Leptothrix sp. (in: b-proteobacteria)]
MNVSPCARPRRQQVQGMLLLGVMVFLAISTLLLTNNSQRWADARQRDAEEELLYVGLQYRRAIESYYFRSPGLVRQFPSQLQDLVKDPRFPQPVRHIRRLWPDPLAPDKEWGLIKQGNMIVGVYSQVTGQPFRTANFDPNLPQTFSSAKTYKDWRFVSGVGVLATTLAPGQVVPGSTFNPPVNTFTPGAQTGLSPKR